MIALWIAVLSAVWLAGEAESQAYTVHSSYVFANTGDRTPLLETDVNPTLTNLGAVQMYNLGAYFRRRYITAGDTNPLVGATMLSGLSSWKINNDEVFIQTVDSEYTASSALAFMQAFYPPYNLGSNDASSMLDQSALLANNTYIDAPLGGYQYATIDTVGKFDPYSVYLTGTMDCDNFENSALAYYSTGDFNDTELATRTMYQSLGHAVLDGVLSQDQWSFANAYLIYDYVTYMYTHNSTAHDILDSDAYSADYNRLHTLASEKQWEIYGDQSVSGQFSGDKIRTIGGQTLAARIAGILSNNIGTGGESTKFNLAVGEYDVMMAFFSLLNLQGINDNFKYIPPYASAFAFELFSYQNETTSAYPSQDELWIRFLYINGSLTDDNPTPSIQAYPIFNRGPSETDMKWTDFYSSMLDIGLENVGDWCVLCNSNSIFCPALTDDSTASSSSSSSARKSANMTPQVAGVIGAAVTLGVLAIALAAAMVLGGIRFRRQDRSKKHDLGGFKGSAKLASDADLHLPKNSAPIGVVATEVGVAGDKKGHERVGSWELEGQKKERGTWESFGGATVMGNEYAEGKRGSFEEDGDGINPFTAPTNPRESV